MAEKNLPIKTLKLGYVKAAIWENKVKEGKEERTFNTVSFQRNYKDGDEWKSTNSFNISDMAALNILSADIAREFGIRELKKEE